ncbi:MAG: 4Fe-4S binding protein [Cyanobacteria bacterium]|nr:4Fe-4S binding protein [Cyanobacteriota bacterium]
MTTPHSLSQDSSSQRQVLKALESGSFFKLIGGGSLTELSILEKLATCFTLAGVDCIDIAPQKSVVDAVSLGILAAKTKIKPLVMVSLPLDPDPHFRKIELKIPDCILCGACVPICPTEAFTLTPEVLTVSQPLCYGCGRCLPLCPTDALVIHPFLETEEVLPALTHPAVGAVEIHSRQADPYMIAEFVQTFETGLKDKLLSICFRPSEHPTEKNLAFIESWQKAYQALNPSRSLLPLIIQVDGNPMSATEEPEASLPAILAARELIAAYDDQCKDSSHVETSVFFTLSGGINHHTAGLIQRDSRLSGVGMGTYARKSVWTSLLQGNMSQAVTTAETLVNKKFPPSKPVHSL